MISVFERGYFDRYRINDLSRAKGPIFGTVMFAEKKKTVFLSHKHDDLDELCGIIGFLEKNYNVKGYIDSKDTSMPSKTCGETANRIKQRINQCDKFILLATNGAIESKWCNWELGYGDAKKYEKKSVAIFPIRDKMGSEYKGHEYMEIYSHIVYCNYGEKTASGIFVAPGYYVSENVGGKVTLTPLGEWLSR